MKVVHCKKEKYDVYIGRMTNNNLHFGNPFSHKYGTMATIVLPTREQAIEAFKKWVLKEDYQNIEPERRDWIINNLHTLKGKILGCWCSPQSCHGDVLIELANKAL